MTLKVGDRVRVKKGLEYNHEGKEGKITSWPATGSVCQVVLDGWTRPYNFYKYKIELVTDAVPQTSRLLVGCGYYGMFDVSAKNTIQSYLASLEGKDGNK